MLVASSPLVVISCTSSSLSFHPYEQAVESKLVQGELCPRSYGNHLLQHPSNRSVASLNTNNHPPPLADLASRNAQKRVAMEDAQGEP